MAFLLWIWIFNFFCELFLIYVSIYLQWFFVRMEWILIQLDFSIKIILRLTWKRFINFIDIKTIDLIWLFSLIHCIIDFLKLLIYLLKFVTIQLLLLYINRLMMTMWFLFQILLIILFTVAIILNTFDLWKVIYLLYIFKFIQTALEWNHLQNTVLLRQDILNIILYK